LRKDVSDQKNAVSGWVAEDASTEVALELLTTKKVDPQEMTELMPADVAVQSKDSTSMPAR